MSQLSSVGEKLYDITSPKSKFNKKSQIYLLEKTKIVFYDKNQITYIVYSNKAELLNHETIKLSGNIQIFDASDDKNNINADNFYWDIKNSDFTLDGNVRLNNKNIDLISSKAILNKYSNIVKFYNPVKYFYKNSKNNSNYNLRAENAYYDLSNKSLIFKSDSNKERVKSKIKF
tara:strand:- start:831 stop:1352 length:522 start_codon:yes stop_codon:yes gene_type:complete